MFGPGRESPPAVRAPLRRVSTLGEGPSRPGGPAPTGWARFAGGAAVWFGMPVADRRLAMVLWGALFAWACTILWLSSLSPDELPDAAFALWDKFNHFAAFTVGGWLAGSALHTSYPRAGGRRIVVLAVLLLAAFGLFDEVLQTITPGRTGADVFDWTADVIGAVTGAVLSRQGLNFTRFRQDAKEHQ